MRELYMKQGQGFLLVFSICNMNSFYELAELREQIIRIKDDEDIPLVVVGNKSDMEDERAVPRARAFQLAQQWGQKPYYETSARRRTNVDEVFLNLSAQMLQKDAGQNQMHDQQLIHRRRDRPNRQDRRGRRSRNRDRCVIL
jgi:Ras-related protein Rap-1B